MSAPVVFLQGNNWLLSTRTPIGFRHTKVGTLTGLRNQDEAIARANELITSGQVG